MTPDNHKLNWTGEVACLVASGPSLEPWQVDYAYTSGCRMVVINNNWQLCPDADVLYACDREWWQRHNGCPQFAGKKYRLEVTHPDYPDVFKLQNTGRKGLDERWPGIRTGSNSGYQTINLVVHFGVRQILLIGYDMQFTDGKKHWHPDHKHMNNPNPSLMEDMWIPSFNSLAPILKEKGIDVINCTINTALTCFERMDIRDAV